MERTLVAFTITLSAIASAHASHPRQPLQTADQARSHDFVAATATPSGLIFARQVLPPAPPSLPPLGGGAASSSAKVQGRTIYLNRDGAVLVPGDNDARLSTSSIVREPTLVTPWEIDDDTWSETVACMKDLYARFDVTITDRDPGDVPHIEAVFGGHPNDVGLPDNVAGVSPFTTDCGIIENSVVFTFTDVLPDDSRLMCEVMAQEVAHSFGLDHQMLASDPMTYLDFDGERTFKDQLASCGEFEDRPCGIAGSVCRNKQNSVQLLESRLGRRGTGAPDEPSGTSITTASEPEVGGCSTSGSAGAFPVVIAAGLLRRRRRRAA